MPDRKSDVPMREIGLFDLQPTLVGLLDATAAFLRQHGIGAVKKFEPKEHEDRGWQAHLHLEWGDFCRILADYPLAVRWKQDQETGEVIAAAPLRAGVLHTRSPVKPQAVVHPDGLLLVLDTPESSQSPPSGVVFGTHIK